MEDVAVEIDVELPIGLDDVWDLITDEESLGEWFDGDVVFTPEVGREGTIYFAGDDEPTVLFVEVVQPGRRLAFRWASPVVAPSFVEFTIEALPDHDPGVSRLTIVERPVPQGQAAATMRASLLVAA